LSVSFPRGGGPIGVQRPVRDDTRRGKRKKKRAIGVVLFCFFHSVADFAHTHRGV